MENSIETIWKKCFADEKGLIAPKINDLYNQKSRHVADRVKRSFRVNQVIILIMSIVLPLIQYFVDALWQGLVASSLLLLTLWYNNRLIRNIKTLDHGATSYDYLRSFDRWLKEAVLKSERIARFSYPLYVLIAISTVFSAWGKQGLTTKIQQKISDPIIAENVPLLALIFAGAIFILMCFFSVKIYNWEVRLMYGRVFDKLRDTITEMEELNEDNTRVTDHH